MVLRLSVCLSGSLVICLHDSRIVCVSVFLPVCQVGCLVCLPKWCSSAWISFCQSIWKVINLFVSLLSLFGSSSVCLSVSQEFCLFAFFVRLNGSVCLFVSVCFLCAFEWFCLSVCLWLAIYVSVCLTGHLFISRNGGRVSRPCVYLLFLSSFSLFASLFIIFIRLILPHIFSSFIVFLFLIVCLRGKQKIRKTARGWCASEKWKKRIFW